MAHMTRTVLRNVRKICMESCAYRNVAAIKTNIVILYMDAQVSVS